MEVVRFLEALLSTEPGCPTTVWSARREDYLWLHMEASSLLRASRTSASSERELSGDGMVLRMDRAALLFAHVEIP